jgi:pimeloyl-ACP methyl ester carboxylesterase
MGAPSPAAKEPPLNAGARKRSNVRPKATPFTDMNLTMLEQRTGGSVDTELAYEVAGSSLDDASAILVWAHGWGQSGDAFRALAPAFPGMANILLDFPGFGRSPPPPNSWGTAEYADRCASLVGNVRAGRKVIWVGHSFGGRVGLQLAARHPELVDGLCLIAAAGLRRQRSALAAIRMKMRIAFFKVTKKIVLAAGGDVEALKLKYGSADYRNAGPMREVFVRVVNEDLSTVAPLVRCPCLLIYGGRDTETPPEFGERFARLIPSSELNLMANQDHYSLLASGRHLTLKKLTDFVGKL